MDNSVTLQVSLQMLRSTSGILLFIQYLAPPPVLCGPRLGLRGGCLVGVLGLPTHPSYWPNITQTRRPFTMAQAASLNVAGPRAWRLGRRVALTLSERSERCSQLCVSLGVHCLLFNEVFNPGYVEQSSSKLASLLRGKGLQLSAVCNPPPLGGPPQKKSSHSCALHTWLLALQKHPCLAMCTHATIELRDHTPSNKQHKRVVAYLLCMDNTVTVAPIINDSTSKAHYRATCNSMHRAIQ